MGDITTNLRIQCMLAQLYLFRETPAFQCFKNHSKTLFFCLTEKTSEIVRVEDLLGQSVEN